MVTSGGETVEVLLVSSALTDGHFPAQTAALLAQSTSTSTRTGRHHSLYQHHLLAPQCPAYLATDCYRLHRACPGRAPWITRVRKQKESWGARGAG